MDIKEIKDKIEDLVEKIMDDKALMAKFQKDPVAVVEKLIGVDLPNDQLNKLVDGVKAKIKLEKLEDKFDDLDDKLEGKLGDALGSLFGRK